jgi:hypothetical protein
MNTRAMECPLRICAEQHYLGVIVRRFQAVWASTKRPADQLIGMRRRVLDQAWTARLTGGGADILITPGQAWAAQIRQGTRFRVTSGSFS